MKPRSSMMSPKTWRVPRALALTACLALVSHPGHAGADYPDHPVRLIAAFSGGLSNLAAHSVAQRVGPQLNASVLVVSAPGANGDIGLRQVSTAPPDGYTLLVGGQWLTTNWATHPEDWNDPTRNLVAIAPILQVPYVIATSSGKRLPTVQALVEAARHRKDSGGLSVAVPGMGTAAALYIVSLAKAMGIQITPVAYKGGGGELLAIMNGEVEFGVLSLSSALSSVKAGRLRALAVTSARRSSALPDVPTLAEAGYAGFETSTWFAVFGPAGLPEPVKQKLNAAVRAALNAPAGKAWIAQNGAEPMEQQTTDALARLTEAEARRWRHVAQTQSAQPSR